MLKKVAITGGLSCGKSTVCRQFEELGAYVVNADKIVHRLLSPNTLLGSKIIALLGKEIVVNGEIDRGKVAEKVFNDQALLQSLETLIHPAVLSEIEKQYQQISKQGKSPLFIAEIPLLFEVNGEKNFDKTIAVWAPVELCRQRFCSSTGYSPEEFDRRMSFQLLADEKKRRADYSIDNSGNEKHLKNETIKLFEVLTKNPS